ncbi:MAG TPA: gamma-D-glutamyl-meso-diaminopimelate peptidase [Ruminococcaceae bacterium]|nr:gamma-D-glutamyl-meso-diaminopimelate peptidase [Oscillospiraceae bacterium]
MDFNILPDYRAQTSFINRLSENAVVFSAGKSLCARNIYALRLGKGYPFALIAAGFHGTEYLTVLAAYRFALEHAAGNNPRSVIIVPCANPDGTEIAINGFSSACRYSKTAAKICRDKNLWKANARGVDINRNFSACWSEVKRRELKLGINKPACTRFGGYRPESEPETKAMTRLCVRFNFSRVIALHSQGREIYSDFKNCAPQSAHALAEKMANASGYSLAQPEAIADGGGFKDWFLLKYRRPAFTAEIGLGENPLPLSDFEAEYPRVRALLNAFLE